MPGTGLNGSVLFFAGSGGKIRFLRDYKGEK